jgi:hypothetical protein
MMGMDEDMGVDDEPCVLGYLYIAILSRGL